MHEDECMYPKPFSTEGLYKGAQTDVWMKGELPLLNRVNVIRMQNSVVTRKYRVKHATPTFLTLYLLASM
eukprot:1160349-Pelagomonas_calceolata.AAC.3